MTGTLYDLYVADYQAFQAEYLKTTRKQKEDYKIQGWDKTCLIAGWEGVRVKKSMNFRSQRAMSKFKFHVRFSPCGFHVTDKFNLRT